MKVMFDINVVLDIVGNREPFVVDSRAAYLKVIEDGGEAYLAVHEVATLYYLLNGSATRKQRDSAMNWVFDSFRIATSGEREAAAARALPLSDFEDALVVASAACSGCELILTRNIKDYVSSPVKALSPTGFLRKR